MSSAPVLLKFKAFEGPTGFNFKDPDSGHLFRASSKQELINQIQSYRAQNRLPGIESLDVVLENYWCNDPENRHKCIPRKLERGFLAYMKGGMALVQNMLFKLKTTPKEAERRGAICITCPLNDFPDKGAFLAWTDSIAEHSLGGKVKSTHHDQLGSCLGCTCVLKAKVWFGGNIHLSDVEEKSMRAAKPECWQLPENQKGTP